MGVGSGSAATNILGYNKEAVEEVGNGINRIAGEAGQLIVDCIHNDIVLNIADKWYSEVAVKYFEGFKEELKAKESDVTDVFQRFSDKIGAAGANWAEATGGEAPTMPAVETVTLDLNIDEIQPNQNGDRFIDENLDITVTQYVEAARSNIEYGLDQYEQNANADMAFFGGRQSDAVSEAAAELGNEVTKMLDSLISGEGSLVTAIQNYREQYAETAAGNANSFVDSGFPS